MKIFKRVKQKLNYKSDRRIAKPSFLSLAFFLEKLGGVPHIKILCAVTLFLIPGSAFAATFDDINKQIQSTEQQLGQTTAQKKTLSGEVAAFDSQIQNIQSQINSTQAEIAKTSSTIEETQKYITKAEVDIARQKEYLREYIRTMYEDGQVSTIELIVQSKNFSEFVNRDEYLQTMQSKVKDTADQIAKLKAELEGKKKALEENKAKSEQLKKDQTLQRQALDTQRYGKNVLLQKTKGDEKAYQKTLGDLYAQRAALSVSNNEGSGGGGSGGYPYSGSSPSGIDPWGFYYRQCTSYAAWRSATYGPVPGTVLSDWGHSHTANGGDWGSLGRSHGRNVSSTPSSGAIMSFPYWSVPGGYGHVAIVTGVNGDGTVNVAEYNWSTPLGYGTRTKVNPFNYGAVFIR